MMSRATFRRALWLGGGAVLGAATLAFWAAGPAWLSRPAAPPLVKAVPASSVVPIHDLHPTGFFPGWFVTPNSGWMVTQQASGAALSRTDDGGASWRPQLPLGYPHLFQRDMSFVDARVGFVAAGVVHGSAVQSEIVGTDDGGASWSIRTPPAPGISAGIDFVSASEGWVLMEPRQGDTAGVLHTTDGARTWRACASPTAGEVVPDHLEGIRFSDALNGWVGAWQVQSPRDAVPLYYHTTDGCRSWTATALPRAESQRGSESVFLVDLPIVRAGIASGGVLTERHGTTTTVGLSLFTSGDRGSSWSETTATPSGSIAPTWGVVGSSAVAALDGRVAALAGGVRSPMSISGSQFLGGGTGFAAATPAGSSGAVLLKTVDAGHTWSVVS